MIGIITFKFAITLRGNEYHASILQLYSFTETEQKRIENRMITGSLAIVKLCKNKILITRMTLKYITHKNLNKKLCK